MSPSARPSRRPDWITRALRWLARAVAPDRTTHPSSTRLGVQLLDDRVLPAGYWWSPIDGLHSNVAATG